MTCETAALELAVGPGPAEPRAEERRDAEPAEHRAVRAGREVVAALEQRGNQIDDADQREADRGVATG